VSGPSAMDARGLTVAVGARDAGLAEGAVGRLVPWLWVFALASVATGAILNESYRPTVLNRFSLPWFGLILVLLLAVVATVTYAVTGARSRMRPAGPRRTYAFLLGLAAAAWGASLLTQYPVDRYHLRRLFVGELFGATQTAGVLCEYVAQACAGLALLLFILRRSARASERGAPRLAGVLLILGSVVAFYLAAEGVTRLANVVWLKPQGEPTKPTRMWHQRYGRLNSFGYRDSEFEPRRASDELRILVVGDSFTYGTGVADRADLFTTVLARELSGTGRFAGVRVFNAGETGADSAGELRHLADLLWLQPDLVILAYVFNDIDHVAHLPLGDTPFGASSMASRFRPHRLLMLNSHLFDQVLLRYRRAWRPTSDSAQAGYMRAYADPALFARHRATLAEIARTAVRGGAEFRLVPFEMDVSADEPRQARLHRFVEAMRDAAIPVWSMEHLFAGLDPAALQAGSWDGHPSARAHRLVGAFLAEQVLSAAWPRAERRAPGRAAAGAQP